MASPETRILIGLATAGVVFSIHGRGMPPSADIRVGKQGDETIETIRKQNLWLSTGAVSALYLLTKDSLAFIMGGSMIVALDWLARANNFANPATGSLIDNSFTREIVKPFQAESNEDVVNNSLYAVS